MLAPPKAPLLLFQPALLLENMFEREPTVLATNTALSFGEATQSIADYSALNPTQAFGRASSRRATPGRATRRKPRARAPRSTVLIVDDVADVTEMIALFLKHAGYEVATADSAGMALQLANSKTFDLIISDIGMPEMNGYELAESLRRKSDYETTPIIAVTGYSEYDDRGRALRAGFNAHLTKPIDPSQLLNLINELLD